MALAHNQESESEETAELEAIFDRHGLSARRNWPWLGLGRTRRQQGWKLHLSANSSTLPELLHHLIETHLEHGFDFKIIGSRYLAALLNEGGFGPTQIGKCATIYPRDDTEFGCLARQFSEMPGFSGPDVLDDVALGDGVFARFGGFNPIVRRDRLGQTRLLIEDETGKLVDDQYDRTVTQRRFAADFGDSALAALVRQEVDIAAALRDRGYHVLGVLKQTAKGRLFQALDLDDPEKPRAVIIKEGLRAVLSDMNGLDIRDRLRHQYLAQQQAAAAGVAARCDPYFEIAGNGYLPIEFQPFDNLEIFIQTHLGGCVFDRCSVEQRQTVLSILGKVGGKLAALHGLGIIHRDISPSNVLLAEDLDPVLSDLEICWSENAPNVFGKGTPGFMAPEQEAGAAPRCEQDVHAFAALCLYGLTGIDPRRLPRPHQVQAWQALRHQVTCISAAFWDHLARALAVEPTLRPGVEELTASIGLADRSVPATLPTLSKLLENGTWTLGSPALLTKDRQLWFSIPMKEGGNEGMELRRSLNRGIAGPLFFCSAYRRHFSLPRDVRQICDASAKWLIGDRGGQDYGMPGLHFGEAGVLLSLYSALDAGVVSFEPADTAHLWNIAFGPGDFWTDVTHGHAGLLIALQLLEPIVERSRHPLPIDFARCQGSLVDSLIENQEREGFWRAAEGVAGMSGEIMSGFAHGVAGIGYALLVCGSGEDEPRRQAATLRAASWLEDAVVPDAGGHPCWTYSDVNSSRWRWWCHGAPGIALFFAALWRKTGNERYRDLALRCLADVPERFNANNLSLCHGVAGLGMLMLDVGEMCDERMLAERAVSLATTIAERHAAGNRDLYWIVENAEITSADLMVGMSGILLFLLRIVTGDRTIAFPGTVLLE